MNSSSGWYALPVVSAASADDGPVAVSVSPWVAHVNFVVLVVVSNQANDKMRRSDALGRERQIWRNNGIR